MNLYDKIEGLYQDSNKKTPPSEVLKQILEELTQIKSLLSENYNKTKNIDSSLKSFVAEFRKSLKPNPTSNQYPEVSYKGRKLGVNFKGLLYDKETGNLITTKEAFEVYDYFYNEHLKKNSIK